MTEVAGLLRGEHAAAADVLAKLRELDPAGRGGWAVVAALADGCAA